MNSPRWSNFTKTVVMSTLVVLALMVLVTFRGMIAPTIVAFLLTFVLSYPVNWVQQRTGWARSGAVFSVYALVLALFALMPALIVPRLLDLIASLNDTITTLLADLRSAGGPLIEFGPFRFSFNNLIQESGTIVRGLLSLVTTSPVLFVRGVTTGIVSIVYTLVLCYWLLIDLNKFQRFMLDLVPLEYQEEMRRLGGELSEIWQAFLRGQLMLGLVIGSITYVCLVIVGMPNAGGLALLAALTELLPSIGPAISGTIGTMSALFSDSSWLPANDLPFNLPFAIIIGVIYAIIGQIESVYFIPRLVGGRVKLHPAVTFVGIINGALAFGVLGILLAAPTIASARTIINYLYRKLTDTQPFEPLRSVQSAIRIPGLIAGRKIEALILDLEGVVSQLDLRALDWVEKKMAWLDPLLAARHRQVFMRHVLVMVEGPVNFFAGRLVRHKLQRDLNRLQPAFDWLRGFPTPETYQLQPGIRDVLSNLAGRYKLVLVTVRPRSEVATFLTTNALDASIFSHIITRDEVRNTLPQNAPLVLAVEQLGLQPDQVLMVSDTDVNLRAARAMEMATAGVLCGLGTASTLTDADVLVKTPTELTEWL